MKKIIAVGLLSNFYFSEKIIDEIFDFLKTHVACRANGVNINIVSINDLDSMAVSTLIKRALGSHHPVKKCERINIWNRNFVDKNILEYETLIFVYREENQGLLNAFEIEAFEYVPGKNPILEKSF